MKLFVFREVTGFKLNFSCLYDQLEFRYSTQFHFIYLSNKELFPLLPKMKRKERSRLTQFILMFHFYTPWKRNLGVSGGKEMKHLAKVS